MILRRMKNEKPFFKKKKKKKYFLKNMSTEYAYTSIPGILSPAVVYLVYKYHTPPLLLYLWVRGVIIENFRDS